MLKQTALRALSAHEDGHVPDGPVLRAADDASLASSECLCLLCTLSPAAAFVPHIRALLLQNAARRASEDAFEPLYALFAQSSGQALGSLPTRRAGDNAGVGQAHVGAAVACNALRALSELAGRKDSGVTAAAVPHVLSACVTAADEGVRAATADACGVLAEQLRTQAPPGVVALLEGVAGTAAVLQAGPAGGVLAALHASLDGAASRSESSSGASSGRFGCGMNRLGSAMHAQLTRCAEASANALRMEPCCSRRQ